MRTFIQCRNLEKARQIWHKSRFVWEPGSAALPNDERLPIIHKTRLEHVWLACKRRFFSNENVALIITMWVWKEWYFSVENTMHLTYFSIKFFYGFKPNSVQLLGPSFGAAVQLAASNGPRIRIQAPSSLASSCFQFIWYQCREIVQTTFESLKTDFEGVRLSG